jgi:hypothetical protein
LCGNSQDELNLFLGCGNGNCFGLFCPYDNTLGTMLLSMKHPIFGVNSFFRTWALTLRLTVGVRSMTVAASFSMVGAVTFG